MKLPNSNTKNFNAAFARICEVSGMKTQTELAEYLGIRQSSISDAKRRGSIPAQWLLSILNNEGVNPAWILTGNGAKYLVPSSLPPSPCCLLPLSGAELSRCIQRTLMCTADNLADELRELAGIPQN